MHCTILLSVLILAATSPYETLRARSASVENLGRFLESSLGDCPAKRRETDAARRDCVARAGRYLRSVRGKMLRVTISEPAGIMSVARFDERKGAFLVNLVPFFAARGKGMSVGRPRRLDRSGRPVMRHLPVWVKLPEDTPPFFFRRNLERGMVQLELVVVPESSYRLRRPGRGDVEAVEVKLRGLRLVAARSGAVLVEKTY